MEYSNSDVKVTRRGKAAVGKPSVATVPQSPVVDTQDDALRLAIGAAAIKAAKQDESTRCLEFCHALAMLGGAK